MSEVGRNAWKDNWEPVQVVTVDLTNCTLNKIAQQQSKL